MQKTWCPACKKAREVLDALAKGKYAIINLDKDEEQDQMQNYLQEITGARTVPRIFIDGNCIGGCDECLQMQKSGKLQSILKEKEIV